MLDTLAFVRVGSFRNRDSRHHEQDHSDCQTKPRVFNEGRSACEILPTALHVTASTGQQHG
jgi:hypothetical protein